MHAAQIALGGNVGDVVATMSAALDALDERDDVVVGDVSAVYETIGVGAQSAEGYLNAAAALETSLAPIALLDHLQQIERALGRTAGERWSSRVIDLDLLLMGPQLLDTPRLTLPHPHLWYRRFVLDPLVEIAGAAVHPVWQLSIKQLRNALLSRPLRVALTGGCAEDRLAVGTILRRAGISVAALPVIDEGPLRIGLCGNDGDDAAPALVLSSLPGSLPEAARAFATAALDETSRHNRPLRRTP